MTGDAYYEWLLSDHPAARAARDLAASIGPRADESAVRAEADHAEPDDLYVARVRAQHETSMRVSGPPGAYG